jgi:hypothetical protein
LYQFPIIAGNQGKECESVMLMIMMMVAIALADGIEKEMAEKDCRWSIHHPKQTSAPVPV